MTANQPRAQDPVVVYDVLRESANRLASIYAERVTVGGLEDPAVLAIIAILDEADAVDSRNTDAQLEATDAFRQMYAAIRAAADPAQP